MVRIVSFLFISFLFSGCFLNQKIKKDSDSSGSSSGIEVSASNNLTVSEGTELVLQVHLSNNTSKSKTLSYITEAVSAEENKNFVPTSGTINVAAGSSQVSITVPTIERGLLDTEVLEFKIKILDGSQLLKTIVVKIQPSPQFKKIATLSAVTAASLNAVELGSKIIFVTSTPENGKELWIANDINSPASLLKDICPGTCGSDPEGLTVLGSDVYFTAVETDGGQRKIYRTDGAALGTIKVFEIADITTSSNPNSEILRTHPDCSLSSGSTSCPSVYFSKTSDRLIFMTQNVDDAPLNTYRIYSTQGTIPTTFHTDPSDDYPHTVEVFNDRVFATREDEAILWDPSSNGLPVILQPGASGCQGRVGMFGQIPPYLYVVCLEWSTWEDRLGRIDSSFNTVWTTTATDFSGTNFTNISKLGYQKFYFYNSNNSTLYSSSGTDATTVAITNGTQPNIIGKVGTLTLMSRGALLYTSDGTAGNFNQIYDFTAISTSIGGRLAEFNNKFYFSVGSTLWVTDGTTLGTVEIKFGGESLSGSQSLGVTSNGLYFRSYTATRGSELYRIDNSDNLEAISEIKSGPESSSPGQVFRFNGQDWMTAVEENKSILRSVVVEPGIGTNAAIDSWGPSTHESVSSFISYDSELYWLHNTGSNSLDVRKYNSNGNLEIIKSLQQNYINNQSMLFITGDYIVFSGYQTGFTFLSPGFKYNFITDTITNFSGSYEYPVSGILKTTNGVFYPAKADGETLSNYEPHFISSVDGNVESLGDLVPGATGSNPLFLGTVGGFTYFMAGPTTGRSLYKSDGTLAGTSLIKSTMITADSDPFVIGNKIVFVATTAAEGKELWVTDGTDPGTQILKDIYAGVSNGVSTNSSWKNIALMNNKVYFMGSDGTNGAELWVSDGTSAGTVMITDMCSGACSSDFRDFTVINNKLIFTGYVANPVSLTKSLLYKSDGTALGTNLVKDFIPAVIGNPMSTSENGSILFTYKDSPTSTSALKLWRWNPSLTNEPELVPNYNGIEPNLLGQHNGWIILKDRKSNFEQGIYLAK